MEKCYILLKPEFIEGILEIIGCKIGAKMSSDRAGVRSPLVTCDWLTTSFELARLSEPDCLQQLRGSE